MPCTERYRGIAEQARQIVDGAARLIENGGYRSAAKVLGDAILLLGQAADERDTSLGVKPGDLLRAQLAASLESLKGAAE